MVDSAPSVPAAWPGQACHRAGKRRNSLSIDFSHPTILRSPDSLFSLVFGAHRQVTVIQVDVHCAAAFVFEGVSRTA
jgi:hypothetical protein